MKYFRYHSNGPKPNDVSILEKKFAELVGTNYALAVNSCSSAILLALKTCVPKHTAVAIPAFTFTAVPSAIVHAECRPVLIEVDENYVIDTDDLKEKIELKNVGALLLSYMRGRVPNLDKVQKICRESRVVLIEDSAHSLGVLYNGQQTGTFGRIGVFSSQSYKIIDSGEGGMFVTNDSIDMAKAIILSGCYEDNWKHHFVKENDVDILLNLTNQIPSYNFRMSNLTAGVLLPQLDEIEDRVKRHNINYTLLSNIIGESQHIRIPKFVDGVRPAADSIQWEFINLSDQQQQQIVDTLQQTGVPLSRFNGVNARCFWKWGYFNKYESCPNTKRLLKNSVDMRLPLELTPNKIDDMGQHILRVIKENE